MSNIAEELVGIGVGLAVINTAENIASRKKHSKAGLGLFR